MELSGAPLLKGCKSDELDDTVCYDILAAAIKTQIKDKEYKLVENLTWDLFNFIKKRLPKGLNLKLAVTKPHAPVEGLLGGASFELEG
jgi:7,8-dihydroneopterin aldolase/epimerase/oxygenase